MEEATMRHAEDSLYATLDSPVGELLLVGDGEALSGLYMQDGPRPVAIARSWRRADQPFAAARDQLRRYFAGELAEFDLALDGAGTAFQRRVWRALLEIPYGETVSYGELARWIRRPSAVRAVGLANGRNPISIVVPCHRVIGADGTLTGYAGGLERKSFLLGLEAEGAARADQAAGSRWRATPAMTRATPRTSTADGIWPRTAIPITVAVAGSSETISA
jgi:methylated-DNA-[protein]-cysteine S-methyltransferase